jgi:hypothetical protein
MHFTDQTFPYSGPKELQTLTRIYGRLDRFVNFCFIIVEQAKARIVPVEDHSEQVFRRVADAGELASWREFEEFSAKAYLFFNGMMPPEIPASPPPTKKETQILKGADIIG